MYTRYKRIGKNIEVISVVPDRGVIAVIDKTQGYRVTPICRMSDGDWIGIDAYLKFSMGLKWRERCAALSLRWGDSVSFLEALYRLEDPRPIQVNCLGKPTSRTDAKKIVSVRGHKALREFWEYCRTGGADRFISRRVH